MDKSDIKVRIKHAIETADDDRKEESSFGKMRYCCMGCDKSYADKKGLSRHCKRKGCNMNGRHPHKCEKCGQILASPQSLWNHKQRCTLNEVKTELTSVANKDGKSTKTVQEVATRGAIKKELTPDPVSNVLQTVHKSSRRTCEKCFKTYSCRHCGDINTDQKLDVKKKELQVFI